MATENMPLSRTLGEKGIVLATSQYPSDCSQKDIGQTQAAYLFVSSSDHGLPDWSLCRHSFLTEAH